MNLIFRTHAVYGHLFYLGFIEQVVICSELSFNQTSDIIQWAQFKKREFNNYFFELLCLVIAVASRCLCDILTSIVDVNSPKIQWNLIA